MLKLDKSFTFLCSKSYECRPTCDSRVEVVAQGHQQHLHPPLVEPGGPLPLLVVEQPPSPVLVGGVLPVRDNSLAEHGVGLTSRQLASELNLNIQTCIRNVLDISERGLPDCSNAKSLQRWP